MTTPSESISITLGVTGAGGVVVITSVESPDSSTSTLTVSVSSAADVDFSGQTAKTRHTDSSAEIVDRIVFSVAVRINEFRELVIL